MKKKLVFILSANYSGSHFLSLLLGSHRQMEHLGELKNLVKPGVNCQMCQPPESCSLFSGIGDVPREKLYNTLFSRVGDQTEVLIDASKKVHWFRQFSHDTDFDIRLIHLIRDPRALARRWLLEFHERNKGGRERWRQIRAHPTAAIKLALADRLTITLYKWYSQNLEIAEFISQSGLPSRVVTYRDIVLNTDSVLEQLCQWLDVTYEPEQKSYWNFLHHGTEKPQYRKPMDNQIDVRWQNYLDARQIARIENHHLVVKMLSRLNLVLADDGLREAP